MKEMKRENTGDVAETVLCVIMAIIIILPLCYVVIVSVSDQKALNKNLLSCFVSFHPENYVKAWTKGRIPRFIINTAIICVMTDALVIAMGSMFAFATRAYKCFKEINMFYYIVMTGMFVPIQTIVLPLFKLIKSMGLLNKPLGLAFVYAGTNLPLSMMMFAGFYKSIPMDLIDASSIDGCTPYRSFLSIVFPLTKTIVCTVVILTSLNIWRDMFIPLMLTTDIKARTIAYGLMSFVNEFSLDWTTMCAAMVMVTIPIIILYLSLQEYFESGALAGAIK